MSNCKAYKKPSCWLPRKPQSEFCATCSSVKERDDLREFTKNMDSHYPVVIVDALQGYQRALCSPLHAALDEFLAAIYKSSHWLLGYIMTKIQDTPIHTHLLHRIRNHVRTPLCPVFGFLLRKNMLSSYLIPTRCLTCLAHVIRYGEEEQRTTVRRMINFQVDLPAAIRSTQGMIGGEQRIHDFYSALLEREISSNLVRSYCQLAALDPPPPHPLALGQWSPALQDLVKGRAAVWKEEFVAKTWHPCRMMYWCLPMEDLVEWAWSELPSPPPLTSTRAEWDIPWE